MSSKNQGFQVSESHQKSRLIERIKLDDGGRSECPFLKIVADVTVVESRRFGKWMLTALTYRFCFEAIGLAGFRVPQKSRAVQSPDI